jgi:hypothetical protein
MTYIPSRRQQHRPNSLLLNISPKPTLRLARNTLQTLICQLKQIIRALAHGINLASGVRDRPTHLVGQFLRQSLLVRIDYIQRLYNDSFPLGEGQLLVRAEGIFGGLGDLADLLERGARVLENDFSGGGRERADLVRHLVLFRVRAWERTRYLVGEWRRWRWLIRR